MLLWVVINWASTVLHETQLNFYSLILYDSPFVLAEIENVLLAQVSLNIPP